MKVETLKEDNANKLKFGPEAIPEILKGVSGLAVAKGQKVVEHNLQKARPDDDELAKLMIGPSGNLRAPTLRIGKQMLVGFNEEIYSKYLT